MSLVRTLKEQPKVLLTTVAITAATLGFAGGMSLSKASGMASNQQEASLVTSSSGTADQAGGQVSQEMKGRFSDQWQREQGMSEDGQMGGGQGMPRGPQRNGQEAGGYPGQDEQGGRSMTPPDGHTGASQATEDTASDEVKDLKERNQEIKSKITNP